MTSAKLLDLAVVAFKDLDLSRPGGSDPFFEEYGIGNTVEHPANPYERFIYYRELLECLRQSDPIKFAAAHKGTPLYFLSWLAFDLHQFESALHFLDAAIEEDRRNAPASWFDLPGAQFVMLNAPIQAARRTVELLARRVDTELARFSSTYNIMFTRADFLRRFAQPMLMSGKFAVVAAFYAFLLEFDDRTVEVQLRSSPVLGSYQPLFLHVFKGGLLLETLLKDALPHLSDNTLGSILQHPDFAARVGFNPPSIAIVALRQLCADATSIPPESAFQAAGRLRNTMGHNLIQAPLPRIPDDYINLGRQAINAYLYAVMMLYP